MKQRGVLLFIVTVAVTILSIAGVAFFVRREPPRVTESIAIERPQGSATGLAFSPDGLLLAIGRQDGQVMLWDVATRAEHLTFHAHVSKLTFITFDSNGVSLLTTSEGDNAIQVWDVTAEEIGRYPTGRPGLGIGTFSTDGTTIATLSGYDIQIWDVVTRQRLQQLTGTFSGLIYSNTDQGDLFATNRLAVTDSNYTNIEVQLYDAESLQLIDTFPFEFLIYFDFPQLLTLSGSRVLFRDLDTRIIEIREVPSLFSTSDITAFSVSENLKYLAFSTIDYEIHVWDFEAQQTVVIFEGHMQRISDLVFSPDALFLASGASDGTVRLWEIP